MLAFDGAHALEQLEALLAGGGVARVIEIDHRHVEVAPLQQFEQLARRRRGAHFIPLFAKQELQRVADVRLVVGDEDAAFGISHVGSGLKAQGSRRGVRAIGTTASQLREQPCRWRAAGAAYVAT